MTTLIGYAPGVFDMFHVGHVNMLRRARLRCDHLIAGVVRDDVAERIKGERPIVPENERLDIVSSVDFVDHAVLETADKLDMWHQYRFRVIFKGDDWRDTDKGAALEAKFAPVGVRVEYFAYTPATSSRSLRTLIEALA